MNQHRSKNKIFIHAFRVSFSTHFSRGPTSSVPGESQLSTGVSIDYSSLMTKDESIVETPGDSNWKFNLDRLTNETCVPNNFSNNSSPCVQNFHTQTDLPSSVLQNPLQTKSFKCNRSDFHQFYDNIIKDVMSHFSFRDSQNPEFQCLYQKALLSAALYLAYCTK